METPLGPAFEVVQPHLLLEFTVRLLASPALFCDLYQVGKGRSPWQVAGIVFALSTSSLLTDDPDRFSWQVDPLSVWLSICHPDVHGSELSLEWTLAAVPLDQVLPAGVIQHLFHRLSIM